jgi:phosphate transport system substrate-binding protein
MTKAISTILIVAMTAGTALTGRGVPGPLSSGIPTGLAGSITISGSSALKPLADAAVEILRPGNPNLSVIVNAGGSGTGLQNVSDGTVDIGNSDVAAEEKLDAARATKLVDHKVCVIGVACIANKEAGAGSVTKDQLIGIFTGRITNWREIGGGDRDIIIVNRPASSGTRALFRKYALDGSEEAEGLALYEENSGALRKTVEQTPGAIAYLALPFISGGSSVRILAIDGIEPTYENIYEGKYPVWGYGHMYTNGEPRGHVKAFLDFMTGEAFAPAAEAMGYGVISKMKVSRP